MGRDLDQRAGAVRLNTRSAPVGRYLETATPEALFVLAAISQYVGATIAVTIFDEVSPRTVAWMRVIGAAVALLAVSRRHWRGWTRRELAAAAVFGVATALMNLFFYLAIDRIDLGKSVAIEFIGPIAVAAAQTRTGRNALALAAAAGGVAVLGGLELSDNAVGLAFLLAASALWATYIVIGAHVARLNRGLGGLGIGLAIGAVAITPIGAPGSGAVWGSARLLVLALLAGVFSNAISYGIDQYVLRRIPVRSFSVLLTLLPVTAAVVGWIGLDQSPSVLEAMGIGLVLLGVVMQERDELAREPVPLPEPG